MSLGISFPTISSFMKLLNFFIALTSIISSSILTWYCVHFYHFSKILNIILFSQFSRIIGVWVSLPFLFIHSYSSLAVLLLSSISGLWYYLFWVLCTVLSFFGILNIIHFVQFFIVLHINQILTCPSLCISSLMISLFMKLVSIFSALTSIISFIVILSFCIFILFTCWISFSFFSSRVL